MNQEYGDVIAMLHAKRADLLEQVQKVDLALEAFGGSGGTPAATVAVAPSTPPSSSLLSDPPMSKRKQIFEICRNSDGPFNTQSVTATAAKLYPSVFDVRKSRKFVSSELGKLAKGANPKLKIVRAAEGVHGAVYEYSGVSEGEDLL